MIGAIAVARAMIPSMEKKVILNGSTNGQSIFTHDGGVVLSRRFSSEASKSSWHLPKTKAKPPTLPYNC